MKSKGFSLIELLIVMVIAAILLAVAIPSYRQYIVKSRRTDGQSALLDLASRMERYYSENNSYDGATIGTGNDSDVLSSSLSPEQWYTLSIQSTASTYTLSAAPNGDQATSDTQCQTLTLDNTGKKDTSTGDPADCW